MEEYVEPAMAYYEETIDRIAPYFFAPRCVSRIDEDPTARIPTPGVPP